MWFDRQTIAYVALAVALGWVLWMDVRPFFRQWVRRRSLKMNGDGPDPINVAPIGESRTLSREAKQLLNTIAALIAEMQTVYADDSTDWEAILLPSEEPSRLKSVRMAVGELQIMETDWHYDKPVANALRDLIGVFEDAIKIINKPEKTQEFHRLMTTADEKAMAIAQQLGAPVRYRLDEETGSRSPQGTGQKTQPKTRPG